MSRHVITTTLRTLNDVNGADEVCDRIEKKCLEEFKGELYGVLMGIAYGGDVERLAKTWGERGHVYGYDTFIGHPIHLAADPTSFEARCMDYWYKTIGTDQLSYAYQRKALDDMGLTNATLVEGEVQLDSCKDLPYITYAFLDMDIVASMNTGYHAVKDKIVPGGYLVLHDVNNIQGLMPWYADIKKGWNIIVEYEGLAAVLQKPYADSTTDQKLPSTATGL